MKTKLDEFEQSIEDTVEKFVPVSGEEKAKIETIIALANKTGKYQFPFSERMLRAVQLEGV